MPFWALGAGSRATMPKPVLATAQDLTDAEKKLTTEIQRVQSLIEPAIGQSENRTKTTIQSLDQKVTAGAEQAATDIEKARNDSKTYTNDSCKALHAQILPLFDPIKADIIKNQGEISEQLDSVNNSLQQMMKTELEALCNKFDEELTAVRNDLTEDMQKWAKEAAEALVEQRAQLDNTIQVLDKKVETEDTRDREEARKGLEESIEKQLAVNEKIDERAQRAQSEIYVKIGLLDEKITDMIRKLDIETKEVHSAHVNEYCEFLTKTERHLDVLDEDTKCIRNAISEVENVPTRRVEWVIKNVSERIRPLTPSRPMLHTSWFSPKFDAAGAHGLQLELQLFRAADPPVDGEDAGNIAIHLWACKGMTLSYRLSCGRKTAPALDKTFNGRVPYGTKRFWFLHEEMNKEDDTLKVSVEILEAIREVEHAVKAPIPPSQDPNAPPMTLEEIYAAEQIAEKGLDGSIFFQRVTNNRLYDQVKTQVEVMQSRMVRKVEWKVESATFLRRCFGPNECICSAAFSAAGVEGMQFVFYPSGYKGSSEGYCSLFLYGPAGATLKCMLSAGPQKREASHSFDEPGAFGRTNFCRFESCIDETDDSILIVLDIEDASQDFTALVKHPAQVPGDKRTIQQLDGSSDKPIESVVKLTKKPGPKMTGKDANLIELKVLPSLWTAKSLGTSLANPDGFHNFDEVKARANGKAAGAGAGGSRMRSQMSMGSSMLQTSGSMGLQGNSSMPTMPTMRDASMRTALEDDLGSQFSKSLTDSRDFATVKKAPAGRRPRGDVKLGASMTAM